MSTKEEKINSDDINEKNEVSNEPKIDEESIDLKNDYSFGWSSYSEITNGRFAMVGFLSIILIELFSKQSFLQWAGIL